MEIISDSSVGLQSPARRWKLLGCLLVACLSLGLSAILADAYLYYRAKFVATYWIVHAKDHSLVDDQQELIRRDHPARLLLLGDSRVFRLPLPVKLGVDLGKLSIINKGTGPGVRSVLEDFVSTGAQLEPVIVFAQIGINDVMFAPPEVAVTNFQQFTKDFPTVVRERGAEPVLSTIIPLCHRELFRYWQCLSYYPPRYRQWNQTVQRINTQLRESAATAGFCLVDLDQAFRDSSGHIRAECFDGDGIHLSTAGNRLLWEQLAAKLQSRHLLVR